MCRHSKVHRRLLIELKTRLIEQTTTFHACSVSKLMLILIDKTKKKICSSETSMKKKKKRRTFHYMSK